MYETIMKQKGSDKLNIIIKNIMTETEIKLIDLTKKIWRVRWLIVT